MVDWTQSANWNAEKNIKHRKEHVKKASVTLTTNKINIKSTFAKTFTAVHLFHAHEKLFSIRSNLKRLIPLTGLVLQVENVRPAFILFFSSGCQTHSDMLLSCHRSWGSVTSHASPRRNSAGAWSTSSLRVHICHLSFFIVNVIVVSNFNSLKTLTLLAFAGLFGRFHNPPNYVPFFGPESFGSGFVLTLFEFVCCFASVSRTPVSPLVFVVCCRKSLLPVWSFW